MINVDRIIQELLQSGATLTLKRAQEISRAMEAAENQAKSIENDFKDTAERVNSVATRKKLLIGKPSKCYRCGKEGHFGKEAPAWFRAIKGTLKEMGKSPRKNQNIPEKEEMLIRLAVTRNMPLISILWNIMAV